MCWTSNMCELQNQHIAENLKPRSTCMGLKPQKFTISLIQTHRTTQYAHTRSQFMSSTHQARKWAN